MPRKPTFDHPVRRLREAIGLTQPEFARLVGVGKDTIQSIENGRLSVSKHLAFKIRRQTGCVLKRTVDTHGSEVFEVRNLSTETLRAYTEEDFKAHQEMLSGFLDKDFKHTVRAASRCIALLLRVAAERGAGTVLSIRDDFEQLITSSFESYRLAPYMKGLLSREWADHNVNLDVDLATKNFPIAPLSTAYSFPVNAVVRRQSSDSVVKAPREVKRAPKGTRNVKV